jgi:MFS transporter, SP family, sugar:H+ symporter
MTSTHTRATAEETRIGQVILITAVATIGGFLFGFDSGVINGTQEGLRQAFGSNTVAQGFNVSSMLLGCALGALIAGRAADVFGRRGMLFMAAVSFVISAWGSGAANGTLEFVLYRALGGLGVGAASVMAPAYIAEIAPARIRGALTTVQQIAIVSGLFSSFLSNYLLAKTSGSATETFWMGFDTWRWMFWMNLIPAVLFFGLLFLIPESPRFLVAKNKLDEARGVLTRLFGARHAEQKVADIQASLNADHKPSFRDLVAGGRIRPIVWVGIGLATFQQLVGINVIFYYGSVLWQSAGFSEENALLQNVLTGGSSILAVLITLFTIDRVGRKPFLLWGSVGMVVTLAIMAFAFSTGEIGPNGLQLSPGMGQTALAAGLGYAFVFNMSWGPVMWVMLGEMFPNQMRGSGLAIAGLAQWLANFLVVQLFPSMLESIGLAASYAIYTGFALVSVGFVWWFVHETKGVELEDMKG